MALRDQLYSGGGHLDQAHVPVVAAMPVAAPAEPSVALPYAPNALGRHPGLAATQSLVQHALEDPLVQRSEQAQHPDEPHRSLAQALMAISDVARAGPHAGEQFIPVAIGKSKFHVYYTPGGGRRVVRVSGPALHVPSAGHIPNAGAPDRLP